MYFYSIFCFFVFDYCLFHVQLYSKNKHNLRTSYLDNNQLTCPPSKIGQLVNLQHLSLYNNQLTRLPLEMK